MKYLIPIAALLLCASAHSVSFQAADKQFATKMCMLAAKGTPAQLHQAVANSQYSYLGIQKKIQCNGLSIGEFAKRHSPYARVIKRLNRR
ncbi:DUF3718 domain-containing protein [Ferrimonas aestuarii]|nr:DUF3718 domain-containing protein [Ferrimonas aestuarii]